MPRRPSTPVASAVLAVLGAAALAHVALAARAFHRSWWEPTELAQGLAYLAISLAVAALGRLALSFLPPGRTGAHDGRGLAEAWAASLALGWLVVALAWEPLARVAAERSAREPEEFPWLAYAAPAALVGLVALGRALTLPGAMVPRHDEEREGFGRMRAPLVALLAAWLAHAAASRALLAALAWLALGVALERALARARRAAAGRALFLLAFVALGNPGAEPRGALQGLDGTLALAAALGFGAAYLVPWLRRADRRAGVLAGLFLGGAFRLGWDPLALAGPLVLVAASRPRQRALAAVAASTSAVVCGLASLGASEPLAARGRLLRADELLANALDVERWGLAWPLLALALLVGVLRFPWRARWTPGAIEEPRREALALAAMVAGAVIAVAWPGSRHDEADVLVVVLPPLALLAGLLAIPAGATPEGR